MATPNLDAQDFFSATLSADISASDTLIYLSSLPTPSEGYLVLEAATPSKREVIYYTSKGANYVACPSAAAGRGVGGSAQSHTTGAVVEMNMNANYWKSLQDGSSVNPQGGWIPLQATLTYSAPGVVSTSVNLTSVLQIGMKMKFTNNSTTYYGYITAITSNSITLNAGTDYTIANSAITSPCYSFAQSPFGFPNEFAAAQGKFYMVGRNIVQFGTKSVTVANGAFAGSATITFPVSFLDTTYALTLGGVDSTNYSTYGRTPLVAYNNKANATVVIQLINQAQAQETDRSTPVGWMTVGKL